MILVSPYFLQSSANVVVAIIADDSGEEVGPEGGAKAAMIAPNKPTTCTRLLPAVETVNTGSKIADR